MRVLSRQGKHVGLYQRADSKGHGTAGLVTLGLITSQNATAPKLQIQSERIQQSLITSQNATAPKLAACGEEQQAGLITSQNATAPKPYL